MTHPRDYIEEMFDYYRDTYGDLKFSLLIDECTYNLWLIPDKRSSEYIQSYIKKEYGIVLMDDATSDICFTIEQLKDEFDKIGTLITTHEGIIRNAFDEISD